MNAHTKLTMHLSRWMYKRGRFKGDAPADCSRRTKSHFRVLKGNGGQMIVRFHNADLLTAYEDGHIVLNTNGWHASPTTRSAMNTALCFFGMGGVSSVRLGGYSQTGIRMMCKTYRYYDGMEFSAEGTLLGSPISFTAKRTDREETAEFRKDIKESGFVGMFPVLYQAAEAPDRGSCLPTTNAKIMTDEHMAHHWPHIVAFAKYTGYNARHFKVPSHDNHKDALKALVSRVTKNMTKLVDLDETVL